jgi:predicted dehydrogenase
MKGSSMASDRVQVGIASSGWVATNRHIPVFVAQDDVDEIYGRAPDQAALLSERISTTTSGAVSANANLGLFLDEVFDIVHVTSSLWSLHNPAVDACGASVGHVFKEKPTAMNLAEAQPMAAEAERGKKVKEALNVVAFTGEPLEHSG